ncbi:hypothetical protein ABDX87_12085 [Pseudomonas abietaniphila]|uniref:hypothetical protein n=1 Tax=Pseudomonas abietaniphila TaxID=89065 RepID=UPI003216CA93
MDKSFFMRNFPMGCLYSILGGMVFCDFAPSWKENVAFMIVMIASAILYPVSRYFIWAFVCVLIPRCGQERVLVGSRVSGMTALFGLICMVAAIPVGIGYVAWLLARKG